MASSIKLTNENGKITAISSGSSTRDVTLDGSKLMHQVDTIVALRASTETPSTTYVTGYHTANDNIFGSNFYKWNSTSTEADNGGTVIKLDTITTGRYELQYNGVLNAKWFGATGDGVTDDTVAIQAIQAINPSRVDLDGGTYKTTLSTFYSVIELTNIYFNGDILMVNAEGAEVSYKTQISHSDFEIARPRTKTPILSWDDREVLWLGTSIPMQGTDIDSYPILFGQALNCNVLNKAWAGSHATYDVSADEFDLITVKSLSMTEDDRVAGLALYGATSVYDDSFDAVTLASEMTCDSRIKEQFKLKAYDTVMLDHNHNDRREEKGVLNPDKLSIASVTIGATTDVTMTDASGISIGDSVALEIEGIPHLNYHAGRVQNKVGDVITLNLDSSAYTGTFTSGDVVPLDKSTVYGSFNFLIYYIKNMSYLYGDNNVKIILSGAPSEFTTGVNDNEIWAMSELLKNLADKWSLSFFDIGFEYDIKLHDHTTFFPDDTHPTTLETRKALVSYWVNWASGGKALVPFNDFLERNENVAELHNIDAVYSKYDQKYSTRSMIHELGATVYDDDFSGGIVGWTTSGTVPTVVTAPWGVDNAVKVAVTATAGQSYIWKNIALGYSAKISFDFEIDKVDGLNDGTTAKATNILHAKNLSGNGYNIGLNHKNDETYIRFNYYDAISGSYHAGVLAHEKIQANTKYTVELEIIKATSTSLGYVLLSLNGVVYNSYELDNVNQDLIERVQLGSTFSNVIASTNLYFGNFTSNTIDSNDVSSRFTGTFLEQGGATVTVVNGIITSVV